MNTFLRVNSEASEIFPLTPVLSCYVLSLIVASIRESVLDLLHQSRKYQRLLLLSLR